MQTSSSSAHYCWSAVESVEVLPGITRQRIDASHLTLIRYIYSPGSVFPQHAHPEEQLTTVLSGLIEFDIDGSITTLGANEVALIPANLPHGARVVGKDTVETLNILSPRRQTDPDVALSQRNS